MYGHATQKRRRNLCLAFPARRRKEALNFFYSHLSSAFRNQRLYRLQDSKGASVIMLCYAVVPPL